MNSDKRTAIVRWLLGLGTLGVAILIWPQLRDLSPLSWFLLISLAVLVALVENLGVNVTYGQVTFMPVAALMAYLALGREPGLAVLIAGLVIGGLGHFARGLRHPGARQLPWWRRMSAEIWPIARNGLSLLAADWAYRRLGATPPLEAISSATVLLAVLEAPVIYLLVHDTLLAADLWLRGLKVIPTLRANWRPLLSIQLLPLMLAPLSALALARIGFWAFVLFELILLAVAIVVNRLMQTRDSLERQVAQLRSFSVMSQELRSSLQIDDLLGSVYDHVAKLLGVTNLRIVLVEEEQPDQVRKVFAVEGGTRVEREAPAPLDDLTVQVLQKREPLLVEPVDQATGRLGLTHPPRARAWMGAPLVASNRLRGAMAVWLRPGEQPDRLFTEGDLAMFTTIAAQTGVTLENALLYEAAQQHAAQLARLNQISTVMNASLNPERVLELIAESVIDVAGCHKAALYLLETETPDPSLLLTHAQGFSPEHIASAKDIAVPLTEGERRLVMDEGRPVVVPNVHDTSAPITPLALLLAQRESFSAYVYLPLRAQKQPIGMLAVYYAQPHRFTEGEIELLETFANQAALAVVNARIYQRVDVQLARRVEQIVHMADINQRLTASLNLETVFGMIIDSAMEGCDADRGVLLLTGDPELDTGQEGLNMVAWRGFNPERSVRMPHHVAEELADSKVLRDGQTLLVTDDLAHSGARSQLSVPIILEESVIGAIALESDTIHAFTGEDVTFVSQLAVQAAVAIRNAQLYKRAQRVRDRLEAILDASNDGLLMIDAKSRIVMTNSKMGEFWDFARGDYQPRSPDQFLADPLTALGEGLGYREGELSELMTSAMRNPNMKFGTDLYVTRAGPNQRQRFVERSVAPVRDEEGIFLGLLLIFRDVTKQKELEQAREDLTGMIVHDLRSPLQAVMGSMRLIGEAAPADNPIIEQATNVSTRAVKKLLNLVNNLLDLSRLERGEFALDPSVESVKAILDDAVQELMPLAQEMDAVVRVEVPDDLPDSNVDRDMVERVVLNLLDNALKYSPPGALVTLKADVVDGSTLKRGARKEPMIRVQMIDTGPGIPDEFKETIFDRYTQVPGQKGRRASAGLGLAFCRLAVESHGGVIWVEDNPDPKGGSIFAFTLPISRAPAKANDEALEKRAAVKEPAEAKPAAETGVAQPAEPKLAEGKSAGEAKLEAKAVEDKPAAEGRPAEKAARTRAAGGKPSDGKPVKPKPEGAAAKGSGKKTDQPEAPPAPAPTNGKKATPPPGDESPGP